MPDGRIFIITVLCDEKWNGDIFVTRDGRKIYQRTLYKYDHYCNSKLRLSRFGVNHQNHIFQNLLQVRLEDVWEKFQRDTSNEPDIISVEKKGNPEIPDLLVTRILFEIGCEVEIKYFDLDNNESPTSFYSLPSGKWATFTLKKKVRNNSVNANNNNNNNNEAMDEDGPNFYSPTYGNWNEYENFDEELPQLRELRSMIESIRQDLDNENLDHTNND